MTSAQKPETTAAREARAAESAGRAAGYCWVEHPNSGLHCTWPPRRTGPHKHTYSGTVWPR